MGESGFESLSLRHKFNPLNVGFLLLTVTFEPDMGIVFRLGVS